MGLEIDEGFRRTACSTSTRSKDELREEVWEEELVCKMEGVRIEDAREESVEETLESSLLLSPE